jgi:hypothetical protein
MGRVSPILVEHPFAGAGWSHALHRGPPAGREPVAGSPAAAVPLMNSLRGGMLAASRPLHEAALADDENPVWEVLDRGRTRAALERVEGLGRRGRMEVFGAVTAALWLSQT